MPGSYPDPRSYANTALQALEEVYEEHHSLPSAGLILKAIEAIKQLKQEINSQRNSELLKIDPYEIDEFNTAL